MVSRQTDLTGIKSLERDNQAVENAGEAPAKVKNLSCSPLLALAAVTDSGGDHPCETDSSDR
jgi:hypothetical protein